MKDVAKVRFVLSLKAHTKLKSVQLGVELSVEERNLLSVAYK